MRKKYSILLLCVVLLLLLTGCTAKTKTNCNVLSVEHSVQGSNFVCGNGEQTYIYDGNAICSMRKKKPVCKVKDLVSMACTANQLFYITSRDGSSLYCYDMATRKKKQILKEYCVVSMKADKENLFVTVRGKDYKNNKEETYAYELLLLTQDKEITNLTQWVATQKPVEQTENYVQYSYEQYKITADDSLKQETSVLVYVEEKEFAYSCLPYNVYARVNGKIVRMEKYLSAIPKKDGKKGCVSPGLTGFYENCFYGVIQYAKGREECYKNPSVDYKVKDVCYRYDPESGEYQVVYETNTQEQIIGFSIGKNRIYLLRKDGIYFYDKKKKQYTFVTKNPTEKKQYGTIYTQYYDGQIYIFAKDFGAEQPVHFVMAADLE